MPEARIDAGQWTLADFGQYLHPDTCLFVSGGVGRRIGVAAGQAVNGTLQRVHGHVQFPTLHAVGYKRADSHLAVTRDQLHPCPALNSTSFCQFRGNFDKNVWNLLANALSSVRKISFVKMLQDPAIFRCKSNSAFAASVTPTQATGNSLAFPSGNAKRWV